MAVFPVLGLVLIIAVALAIRYRYLNKKTQDETESFYERERRANSTPKKDISNLNYIKIPLDKFPIGEIDDAETKAIEQKLIDLSEKDIINLAGKTNTDLKEEYGAPNFDHMQQIGENFNELTVTLVDYASDLMLHNMYDAAISVLEYGIVIKTDVSKNYTMLADCYKYNNQPRRIETLKEQALGYEGIMRESILRHIDKLLDDNASEDFEG